MSYDDAAVGAVAKVIDPDSMTMTQEQFTQEYGGFPAWSSEGWAARRKAARGQARAALEAAAPLIAAKAWNEGYQACRNRPRVDGYLINRSNPYGQIKADS